MKLLMRGGQPHTSAITNDKNLMHKGCTMKSALSKLVLTCTGSVTDEDLEERLAKIKTTLEELSQTNNSDVNLSKVEPWNSVRVTFNIPPEAAARLRELAQRGDPNLHKLGILTVQVENGETISLPPPLPDTQRSLFSPPPPTLTGLPQLPPSLPVVPPSPTPVVSSPVIPASTLTPGTMLPGHALGAPGTGPNFSMPGLSLQQLTRPPIQGLQAPGSAPAFPQQGMGNLWNHMGVSQQQHPMQPSPASFWNQIPFFPQVNITQANQPQGVPSSPQTPPVQQPKPQPKKRRKRTKKANIQPPDLAVAAGQPLLPLPPHLQNLPPPDTNTRDNADNLNTNKPSNLTLPPSLIDNPVSPNTPPSTAVATGSTTAPIVASSANPSTQFSFSDIPMSRGLVSSPQTQQVLKKADVALTSPLLVNLLQSDISAKQFPFANPGSKTTATGTDTSIAGHTGQSSQDVLTTTSAAGINTSSPFVLPSGNGISTMAAPNTAIANLPQFLTAQGGIPSHISTSGQFLPPNTLSLTQTGQLTQEQLQFHLGQLSASQLSQAQVSHAQSFPGNISQSPLMPGQNLMQPGHMQPFQVSGGHHIQGPPFPGPMPHNQLPNVRMSVGPITTQDSLSQSQMRLGGPMFMGHMHHGQMPTEHAQFQPKDSPLGQAKGHLQPIGQLQPVIPPSVSSNNAPVPPSVNPKDTWTSINKEKQGIKMDSLLKKPTKPNISDSGVPKPGSATGKPGDDIKKSEVPKLPEEPAHVFDEEAALLGMTEAERDTMAVAAIIAKEAKMAADAKNGKQAQNKDVSVPKSESQPTLKTSLSPTTSSSSDGISTSIPLQPTSTPSPTPIRSLPESQPSRPPSTGELPVIDRRPSNSPVRLSPPKIPESMKQRRTPPSTSRPVHQQQPHYGPIPGNTSSSMSSGIAGLQTLTSRTFSASTQPSIRDMALSRNQELNTLSQFLSSVTPPNEILQMAPLFRSNKQQDMLPKSTSGISPVPTAAPSEWLPLPNVNTQKHLPLPAQIGARTPMQPTEFSAATERMLGSMLDTQKPGLSNIARPSNQPRVITTEGINFVHRLVGRAPPLNPQNQGQSKDTPMIKEEQSVSTEPTKKDDKSELKALLNEVVIPEKCPHEKQLPADNAKIEKPKTTSQSTPTDLLSSARQRGTIPAVTLQQVEQWIGFNNPAMSLAQAAARKADTMTQSSNITSIYIPPTVMGHQQHQVICNQPLTISQQTSVSSNVAPTAQTSETSLGSLVSQSSTDVEGSMNQLDKAMKTYAQASSSLFPSQPVGTLARPIAAKGSDDHALRLIPQEFFPHQVSESRAREQAVLPASFASFTSHQQLPKLSCSSSRLSKSPVSQQQHQQHQQPSLQETPMTVLERAPQILLSPATLSTASQELIKSLGAHGTIATLPPASEISPDTKTVVTEQEQSSAEEKTTQQLQELRTQEPQAVKPSTSTLLLPHQDITPLDGPPETEASQTISEGTCSSVDSYLTQLQAAVPKTSANEQNPSTLTSPSTTSVGHLQADGQHSGITGVTSQVVTSTELITANVPAVLTPPFNVTAVASMSMPSASILSMSEVSELKQISKMPLSQLVSTTLPSRQSPVNQPETSIPSVQPLSLISQQPSTQRPTVLQETPLLTEEPEKVISPTQTPEPVHHSEALRSQSPNIQPSFSAAKASPEKTLKTSPEKLKHLENETASKGIECEAEKIAPHLYKKASGDKRPVQQVKTPPSPVTSFNFSTTSQTTTTSPVKPTAFSSASSTLVQAQSIMVKTAAMSRTTGIMKATEQTTRPVRSRTPPRASLSTLPPNTCNNESLGSASALLSSIAKSAWTVTTAMASAAKAKVVPTPKAPEKNLARLRRSPETLPPTGKITSGDRDKGLLSQDASSPQPRTPQNVVTIKHPAQTPQTESFTDASQASATSQDGSLPSQSVIQSQPSHYEEQTTISANIPLPDASVTIFSGGVIQQVKPPSKFTTPTKTKSPSSVGRELTAPVGDSPEKKVTPTVSAAQHHHDQTLPYADESRDFNPQSKASDAISVNGNPDSKSFEEEELSADQISSVGVDSRLVPDNEPFTPSIQQVSVLDGTVHETSQTDSTGIPSGPYQMSYQLPIESGTETQDRHLSSPIHALEDKEPSEDTRMESLTLEQETTVLTPSNGMAVKKSSAFLPTSHQAEPVFSMSSDLASQMMQVLQTTAREPPKRPHTGDIQEPPVKQARISPSQLSQTFQEETKESLTGADVSLSALDANIAKTDTSTVTTPRADSESSAKMSESLGQVGQSKDKQEKGHSPICTEISLRDNPKALGTEGVMNPEVTSVSESIGINVTECTPGSQSQSFQSSDALKTDSPLESSLLAKPEQITNLVEKVIQRDPDVEAPVESITPTSGSAEADRHEFSRRDTLESPAVKATETQPGLSRKTEGVMKSSDREQNKDIGLKVGKEAEGEFEPRRTRHTSEEVPGMSTRSLRSGRRSPGEPSPRGKDKEESPPTTRGRGQKEKEIVGESDADALSRKRSTRSSGRDMYYGPIPSYKRRKTNQK